MNTYTRRRHGPQGQDNTAGGRNVSVYTEEQHGVVPGSADGVDQPFPNKPVYHRRSLNPRKQSSLDLSPQEHNSNGIRKTTRFQDPRKDSHGQPSGELLMARAIREQELVLQKKLWSVEEKLRQKIQRTASDDRRREEQRHGSRRAERAHTPTRTRPSEQQRREPVMRREMTMQERGQEDVKQLKKLRDQDERTRVKRRDIEVAQSQRKDHKSSHHITIPEQEVSGELNKLVNVNERTRSKGRDKKGTGIWEGTGVKSQDTTSTGNKGWTREKIYKERTCKEMNISDDERGVPQMSRQKASHASATETHVGVGRKPSREPMLPPASNPSHSSTPEQGELRQGDSTDHQLFPCKICNRKFLRERLQTHVQICKKVKSHRGVFNSYAHRIKGTAQEEFWKTHSKRP